jgi:hypothetical protein
VEKSIVHLETALKLDPLLLTAATELEEAYRRSGRPERAEQVAQRMRLAMSGN